jgi:hypothetical protein
MGKNGKPTKGFSRAFLQRSQRLLQTRKPLSTAPLSAGSLRQDEVAGRQRLERGHLRVDAGLPLQNRPDLGRQ